MLGILRPRRPERCLFRSGWQSLVRWKSDFDNFLYPNNSQFIDNMYKSWLKDPNSVVVSWDKYFRSITSDNPSTSTRTNSAGEFLIIFLNLIL